MTEKAKVTLNADKTFTVESGSIRTNINYENTEQGKAMLEGKVPSSVTVDAESVMILGEGSGKKGKLLND
jgi:hypothetical protein